MGKITEKEILALLPYTEPFLFVDTLTSFTENGIEGKYSFNEDAHFYKGHFKNRPITPGVILTECMAQIGLVCLGIFLMLTSEETKKNIETKGMGIALSSTEADFYKSVLPGETVSVVSEKLYYRFGKLRCKVRMFNANDELVCMGTISGMIVRNRQ